MKWNTKLTIGILLMVGGVALILYNRKTAVTGWAAFLPWNWGTDLMTLVIGGVGWGLILIGAYVTYKGFKGNA